MSGKSVTIKVGGFIGTLIYLALGMLYHLATSPDVFAWGNPWLYVDMFLWPIWLLGWLIAAILIIIVAIGIIWYIAYELPDQRRKTKARLERKRKFDEDREERRRAAAKATPSAK